MHEIAVELYMQDHKDLKVFNIPEETELREGGYLDRARVLAIKKVTEQEPGKHKTLRKVKDHGEV